MAYTYREAIKTAYKYLHIDESKVEVIENTNGRGIVYSFDGIRTVIFIYPISCKQNNKQNFFDTRDSGAKERAITWKYASENNLRYFCFGFNEDQERYKDYVLSLESSEKSISDVSYRKSALSESTGTQVNIPNDFIPHKKFERIKTPKGFYIAAIRKDFVLDYITMFDNRPYQGNDDGLEGTDLYLTEDADETYHYASEEGDDNREKFRGWMKKQVLPEGDSNAGQPYSDATISSYIDALDSVSVDLAGKQVGIFKCNDPTVVETEIEHASVLQTALALTKYKEFLTDPEAVKYMERLKNCMEIKRKPRQSKRYPVDFIIYGAPGTGKTYSTAEYALAIIEDREVDLSPKSSAERLKLMSEYNKKINDGQVVFTTFHQSYGYEEFIQGLRPDPTSDKLSFDVVDGVFKRIADRALNDQDNNYVIIIDEINRANISKVFGELITLIEEDKRWGEINQLCATLQSGDVFAVPNNLYIVGTMNSADKSISLIDAALRRRFEFIEQKPQPELVGDPQLKKVLISLNTSLADELESADLLIGHSYFMNKTADDLVSILNNSIIPLLYEYFYDNKKKVISVLSKAIEKTGVSIEDDKMGRLSVKKTEA